MRLFEFLNASQVIKKKSPCHSQHDRLLLHKLVMQKYHEERYFRDGVRQACLYFKASACVFPHATFWGLMTPECHYNDVIMGAIASQITSLTIVYSIFIQTQIKENIKDPRHWPVCGEFTGDRWIPRTNGQLRGKCFHLMTSSWCQWPRSY